MILTTRKVLDEGTQWTRVEHRLKTWLYSVMHELVQAQVINSLIYKLLLIIEALQFLWYAIHPHFNFLWTVKVVDWLREFLRFLQFDGFLTDGESNSQNIFIIILYIVFGIQVLMTGIIICQIRFSSPKKQPSTIMAYSIKALSGYILLLNTVFTLPFYYIFLAAFICRSGDPIHGDLQCYKSTYFVHFVAALLGIILLIPISVLTATLCIDLNPWSSTPFASPKSRLNLVKLASKILIPIFFIIDYNGEAAQEFLIVYAVFWLLMLVLRYRQTPYYKKAVFNLTLTLEMFLFWSSLVGVFHAFIDNFPIDNIGFLFLWIGAPFITFTYAAIVNKRRKIYRRLLMKNMKKDTEVEMYITTIIDLIEERNNIRKRITLEGLLKFHMKTCSDKEFGCVCHSLHSEYLKDQDAPEKVWYLWVKAMILEGIQKFPKSSRLRMLYAYIQREKLHNKFKALFEIMYAYNNKPTLEEEFSIYRYKNLIEEEMVESDMKIAENKGVNVNVIVGFENKFVDFQFAIGAAVELHLDFWRELQENNPEIQKLQSLGSMITKSVEEVTKHYQTLLMINPNHVKMLQVYGNFLRDIINDEAEGQKILEKAEYNNRTAVANRQFLDNERLKYGDNSNTCIITVSGEVNTMGIVTNANNDITRILGFNKSELIGQNIYNIMPKFLTEIHDGFMHNYFESADAKVIAIERVVFPINKLGYIVPCTLMAKVLPNLDEGLKLVGFLKEIDKNLVLKEQEAEAEEEEDHYVMYDVNTGIVHGITFGCKKEFGIPASLVQNPDVATDEFTIDQIFPEITQINLEELKNSGGLLTVIDTSSLEQDYIIDKGEEGSGYGEGEDKERKFRKAKVKVSLFQDDEYGDISLRVLKFMEIKDDDHASPKYPLDAKVSDGFKNEASLVKVRPGEKDGQEELEGSRMDQNASELESNANNELNEEMRDLKEFKAMISEKTVPKSIRLLRNAVIIIYILMLALVCLSLGFYSNVVDEFNSGTSTISDGYKRHDITAEINYRLRKLQLLAAGITTTASATETNNLANLLRSQETALIDSLRTVTLQIGDDQDRLQSLGLGTIETDNVMVESLIQNGNKIESRFFSDAMSQYTSHATSASNAALTSFTTSSVTDSTLASFYYVRRNGLASLRDKSEYNAGQVTSFYIERTNSYDIKFRIIMIALIVLVGLSELILIPIIFSVHKTATKVLSLFGYIPLNEIVALSNKCEKYIQHYLENHRAQHEYGFENEEDNSDRPSKTSRMGEHTYVEVNQGQDNHLSVQGADQDVNASYLVEMSLEDSTRKISGLKVPETMLMKQVTASPGTLSPDHGKGGLGMSIGMDFSTKPFREDFNMTTSNQNLVTKPADIKKPGQVKEDEKKVLPVDNEEDLDLVNDRPTKLLNSKDNTKSKVIVQFCFIGLLFVAYFVMNYVIERQSLQNLQTEFTHLQMVSQRMPNVRFLNAFTLETLAANGTTYVYPTSGGLTYNDLRADYHARTLANSGNLKDSASGSFPTEFDGYLSLFTMYNDKDLCANFYNTDSSTHSKCLSVGGGLLTQGLTLSITRITQFSNDLINDYSKNMTVANQKTVINSDKLAQVEGLTDMIAPVIGASRDKFLSSFRDYLTYCWTVARIRFAVFVSIAILAFIVVWTPYLKSMKDKIFRTKGMLNMIPMELIAKNANLRSLFVNSGDILQAVK